VCLCVSEHGPVSQGWACRALPPLYAVKGHHHHNAERSGYTFLRPNSHMRVKQIHCGAVPAAALPGELQVMHRQHLCPVTSHMPCVP
jgi:hypothetical protein